MESYVAQCEKEMPTGKRENLQKILQTKLDEQKRQKENKALEKTSSPPKTVETVPTPTVAQVSASISTTPISETSVHEMKGKASGPKERKKAEEKQKEKEPNVEEIVAIESDVESKEGLVIDD